MFERPGNTVGSRLSCIFLSKVQPIVFTLHIWTVGTEKTVKTLDQKTPKEQYDQHLLCNSITICPLF